MNSPLAYNNNNIEAKCLYNQKRQKDNKPTLINSSRDFFPD